MAKSLRTARDPFAFSLRGVTTLNSYAPVPAVADTELRQASGDRAPAARGARVRGIEDFLARYFAPGCCGAA